MRKRAFFFKNTLKIFIFSIFWPACQHKDDVRKETLCGWCHSVTRRPQRLFKHSPEMRRHLLRFTSNTDLIVKDVVRLEQLFFDFMFVRRGEQQQADQTPTKQACWDIPTRLGSQKGQKKQGRTSFPLVLKLKQASFL